ncbi:nuclear pore complex protein NUP93A-like [Cucurbita pepo subsp. pepo]|uniref:nuclear pore complex protein NUP93A-like n=1 Tax=Cucurbita pepo subsp. pepo TaxID=3664 RepID=UPI000C9D93E7|nr:nuclear pore complex protein NUP93A-like [Cucurbita pepo subsp. pepo]
MAMISAIQEAQKDNVRSFNGYMMKVLEEDWKKEKRDFLQSLSRISTLPRTNMIDDNSGAPRSGQIASFVSSPHVSSGFPTLESVSLANKPTMEKKASTYAEVVKKMNDARERGLPFKPAVAFKGAYESLDLHGSAGKSVNMQKIWHLIQTLMGEDSTPKQNVSKTMSLILGARRHLELGHEKYMMDTIQSHPAQVIIL